jgi:mitochondrial fission protein ELM1
MQIWSIHDGRAGNARQAGALADALAADAGGPARDCALAPRAPWRWAAPRVLPGAARHAFGDGFAALLDGPPGLAVGCGRQAALATRLLRARGWKAVQVLDPRIDPAHWDLVVAPMHDGLAGANVIATLGSLNPVDDAWLADARARFAALETLPRPRTAVLLGGGSAHARFDRSAFDELAARLDVALAREGGSVLSTASRRTPDEVRAALRRRFDGRPGLTWAGDAKGPNPYPGLLAWADRIVCTPDSVNMVSEACATRAPVFVFEPERVHGRPRRFLDALLASGRIRAMDDALAPFDAPPLRETARVATEIRRRLHPSLLPLAGEGAEGG